MLDSHDVDWPAVVFPARDIGRHSGKRRWYLAVEVLLAGVRDGRLAGPHDSASAAPDRRLFCRHT
ncbi:MAG: hypothetical protein WAL16_19790 [Streptosporangiaceae bacterium]